MTQTELIKRPADVQLERLDLDAAVALATQKPDVAGQLIMALLVQNTDELPNTSFVRRQDGAYLKKVRMMVTLSESEGTLVTLGRGKYDLSLAGYRKLNELPAIQVIRPEHVTVDGQRQMNPYIQVDAATKMPEVVYARCLAVGYSPMGSLSATDVMVRLDINIYLLENIQSKMDKAPNEKMRDEIGIYGSKDTDHKPRVFFPIHSVGGIGLWVNLQSAKIQSILRDHTTRLKFIERLAQSFSERNALKAHPSMPKAVNCDNGVAHIRMTGWTTDFDRAQIRELQTLAEDDRLEEFKDGTGQTIDVQAREVITEMDSASSASMEVEVEGEQGHEAKEKVTSGMDGGAEGEPLSDAELLALASEAYGRLVDLKSRSGAAKVLADLGIENIEEAKADSLHAFLQAVDKIESEE